MNPKDRFIINLVLALANVMVWVSGIVTHTYSTFSIFCGGVATACFVTLAAWAWIDIKK